MQEHIRRAHPEHYISKLPATEESFRRAAEAELEQADPVSGNEFKVELARRTIVATLSTLAEGREL